MDIQVWVLWRSSRRRRENVLRTSSGLPLNVRLGRLLDVISERPQGLQIGTSSRWSNRISRGRPGDIGGGRPGDQYFPAGIILSLFSGDIYLSLGVSLSSSIFSASFVTVSKFIETFVMIIAITYQITRCCCCFFKWLFLKQF